MKFTLSKLPYLGIPILLFVAVSCNKKTSSSHPERIDGWAPVYGTEADLAIQSVAPKAIENGGKIYIKGSTLYQLETGKGIHIINVTQPDNPQKTKFITVAGAQEMAIKDNYLYANSLNDLVVIDISNVSDAKLVTRTPDVFHLIDQNVPPEAGYFECVDASKGKVIGWEQKVIMNPKCIRN